MNPLLILGWCRQPSWGFAILISLFLASPPPQDADELQHVLNLMDQTAASFRSAQAAFVWDQYQKVVDEHDTAERDGVFSARG